MASPENFPRQTDYRNPVIAEAMATLGYVNAFGRGVIRAQEALRRNGYPGGGVRVRALVRACDHPEEAVITIAFFNNKGGVGKTSLVYHLAWMYADLGISTVAVDIDPQASLSTTFLEEERLDELLTDGDHPRSILGAVSPVLQGTGDISEPYVEPITSNLGVVVGDLGLSRFEAKLSLAWPSCLDRDEAAFRIESAFHRTILKATELRDADVALIDVGPNLGAINRSAIIAANFVGDWSFCFTNS